MKWILVCCLVVLVVGHCQATLIENECRYNYCEHECREMPDHYCSGVVIPFRRDKCIHWDRDNAERTHTPESYETVRVVTCRMNEMCDPQEDNADAKEQVDSPHKSVSEQKKVSIETPILCPVVNGILILNWIAHVIGAMLMALIDAVGISFDFICVWFGSCSILILLYCALFSRISDIVDGLEDCQSDNNQNTSIFNPFYVPGNHQYVYETRSPTRDASFDETKVERSITPEEEVEDEEPSAPELQETEEERLVRIQGLIASWPQ